MRDSVRVIPCLVGLSVSLDYQQSVDKPPEAHPRREALDAYAQTAGEIHRTDLHGHVEVRSYEDGTFAVLRGDEVASGRGGIPIRSGAGESYRKHHSMGQRRAVRKS